ncbi:hypothetical protein ZIOFF_036549 [Zingiber officinale]|uniref:Uncharacterized protein n=1 Tax=Zingiber officinale TaxID=94328 RepID=A0A8J5KYQ1_ZINOF|nr:hypothetical protein ZIOFF_036549 [Zingiber officinale]
MANESETMSFAGANPVNGAGVERVRSKANRSRALQSIKRGVGEPRGSGFQEIEKHNVDAPSEREAHRRRMQEGAKPEIRAREEKKNQILMICSIYFLFDMKDISHLLSFVGSRGSPVTVAPPSRPRQRSIFVVVTSSKLWSMNLHELHITCSQAQSKEAELSNLQKGGNHPTTSKQGPKRDIGTGAHFELLLVISNALNATWFTVINKASLFLNPWLTSHLLSAEEKSCEALQKELEHSKAEQCNVKVERGVLLGSRGSDERPQRSLPRAPLHLRSIGFAEANTVSHHLDDAAAVADRSYKVSSRIVSHERKWGTSVVELETKLSKAQAELKKLKDRLASAEAAEVETEKALAKAKKRLPAASVDAKGAGVTPPLARDSRSGDARQNDKGHSVTSPATMDVFEVVVPVGPLPVVDEVDGEERKEEKEVMEGEGEETKGMIEKTEREEASSSVAEKDEEEKEVRILKSKLLAKEKELAIRLEENMIFKIKAEEQAKKLAESAQTTQEQLMAQLNSMEEELKQSKTKEQQLNSQLEAAEGENTSLEMELKRTKVQMDQWRKAAEAAAEVLATGNEASAETGDKRLVERCMSMDKHLGVIAGAMEENDNGGGELSVSTSMACKLPPPSSSLSPPPPWIQALDQRLPIKNHSVVVMSTGSEKHASPRRASRSESVTEETSNEGSSARNQLDLLQQLASPTSEGYEGVDGGLRRTVREQLSEAVGGRGGEFTLPLGKKLKASLSSLTVSQRRNIKRQAYLNEVGQRNDSAFFATVGAFVLLPPLAILAAAVATGYVQLFP